MAVVKLAEPVAPRYKMIELFTLTTGLLVSSTVMVAVAVLKLPLASVTVRVTGFEPTLAQVKLVWVNPKLTEPQLSLLPLLTMAGVMLTVPLEPK